MVQKQQGEIIIPEAVLSESIFLLQSVDVKVKSTFVICKRKKKQ